MATLDELLVRIDASTELLRRELNKGDGDVKKFERRTTRSLDKIDRRFAGLGRGIRTALGSLGVAFSVGGLVAYTRSVVVAGDAIDKAAQTAGVGAETIQELRFAFAQLAGTTDREVDESLRRFNRRIGLAANGEGEAFKTTKLLNIALRDQRGALRGTSDVLDEAIQKLAQIRSDSVRAARASQLFGEDAGPRLAAALGQGVDAMNELREATPGVLSDANVKAAAALNDAFDRMARTVGGSVKNAFIEATVAVGDFLGLVDLTEEQDLALQLRNLDRQIEQFRQAQATGSLGGNEILLERAIERRQSVQNRLRTLSLRTPFSERRQLLSANQSGDGGRLQTIESSASRLPELRPYDHIKDSLLDVASTSESVADEVEDQWATLGNSMGFSIRSTLADAFLGVETSFGDMIRRMLADLAASGLLKLIGSSLGGPVGAFFSGAVSGRASGGPVSAGTPYLVGERGPELFVPRLSGNIVSNGAMAPISIVTNIDARGATQELAAQLPALLARNNERVKAEIRYLQSRRQ